MIGEIQQKKVSEWVHGKYLLCLKGVTIENVWRLIGICILQLMNNKGIMLKLYFPTMRKIALTTMFIPIFCLAAMINPEFCMGQSNSTLNDSKGQFQDDQRMLNEASFNHNLTTKDKSVTPATTMDKNQTTAKNIHISSRQLATPKEIKATSSGIWEKNKIFLPKELTSLLLTLNKEVFDPNRANSGQTAAVRDESNLFGAFFPGLLNEKIL